MIAQALFVGNYFLVDTYAPEILPTPVRYILIHLRYYLARSGILMHLRYYLHLSVYTYAPEILPTPVRYTYAPEILPTPVRYIYAPEILPTLSGIFLCT